MDTHLILPHCWQLWHRICGPTTRTLHLPPRYPQEIPWHPMQHGRQWICWHRHNGTMLLAAAASVCQAIYLCCSSNTIIIHNPPNQDYLHINVSLLPTGPSCTSHQIRTPRYSSMLTANVAFKTLWGQCSTTHKRLITNYSWHSASLLPAKPKPPLSQNKQWTSYLTTLLPILMTALSTMQATWYFVPMQMQASITKPTLAAERMLASAFQKTARFHYSMVPSYLLPKSSSLSWLQPPNQS